MEDEEDDDIYAPEDVFKNGTPGQLSGLTRGILKGEKAGEDLEEGEEEGEEIEEEDSDSVPSTLSTYTVQCPDRGIAGH